MKHEHSHHEHHHGHAHEHVHSPDCGHIEVHEHSLCAGGLCGHIEHMRNAIIQAEIESLVSKLPSDDDYEYDAFGRKIRKKKAGTTTWQPIYT